MSKRHSKPKVGPRYYKLGNSYFEARYIQSRRFFRIRYFWADPRVKRALTYSFESGKRIYLNSPLTPTLDELEEWGARRLKNKPGFAQVRKGDLA